MGWGGWRRVPERLTLRGGGGCGYLRQAQGRTGTGGTWGWRRAGGGPGEGRVKRNRGRRGMGNDRIQERISARQLLWKTAGGQPMAEPKRHRRVDEEEEEATTRRRGGTERGGANSNVGDKGAA